MIRSLADIKRPFQPGFAEQQTEPLGTRFYESHEPLIKEYGCLLAFPRGLVGS